MLNTFAEDFHKARRTAQKQAHRRIRMAWAGRYTEQAIVNALQRFARMHGRAPIQREWTLSEDPSHEWPNASSAKAVFEKLAVERGLRWYVLSDDPEEAWQGRGDWEGVKPWEYMLACAGLTPCDPRQLTRSDRSLHGRARQMVTAGRHDVFPARWDLAASQIEILRP